MVVERPKRTKQYTKEELLEAIDLFDNDKEKIAEHLNIGTWSLRKQLKRLGIYEDKMRIPHNKKEIPPKEILEDMYFTQNMTVLEMSKHLNVANGTVKKWFQLYDIKIQSLSDTIKYKVMPKIIKHNNEKYGVDHFYQSEKFKERYKNTCIEKYGKPYHPTKNYSNAELEVLDFFNSLIPGFEKGYIENSELDGYNKNIKVAFEYCGLYWHREGNRGKELHRKKYDLCKENGIRLFTIFEDEWIYRKTQVKNFIKAALGIYDEKLYARKLIIKVFDRNDNIVVDFLNNFHIQGNSSIKSTIFHYGLINNTGDLMSLISIGKHHRNVNEIVLSRYCIKNDIMILGGAQKLMKFISNEYIGTNIKTWSDNRWTEGILYEKLGFKLIAETKSDYSYISINGKAIRKSKQSMTKKAIGATNLQTEYERAIELGYDRIWDCGKKTWILENKKVKEK